MQKTTKRSECRKYIIKKDEYSTPEDNIADNKETWNKNDNRQNSNTYSSKYTNGDSDRKSLEGKNEKKEA